MASVRDVHLLYRPSCLSLPERLGLKGASGGYHEGG